METRFTPENAAILLIDHQDMTVSWIKSLPKEVVIANVRMLARLGAEMHIPLLVASTMEERVGSTIEDIQDLAPRAYAERVKRGGTLNCFLDAHFKAAVRGLGRQNLIIAGLTTDICCYHTTAGALGEGYTVQVVADACGSMSALSDQSTYARLRRDGAVITGGNQVLTELYQDFGTPEGQRAAAINMEEIVARLAA